MVYKLDYIHKIWGEPDGPVATAVCQVCDKWGSRKRGMSEDDIKRLPADAHGNVASID